MIGNKIADKIKSIVSWSNLENASQIEKLIETHPQKKDNKLLMNLDYCEHKNGISKNNRFVGQPKLTIQI